MEYWAKALFLVGGRYFLFAGAAFLLFYVVLGRRKQHQKIQLRFPQRKDYWREIGYSSLTILIFSAVASLLLWHPAIAPHTTRYAAIDQYGWVYYFAIFPVMLVMHDTYFYFAHRVMHHKRIFPWVHLVHHRSTNPSPWAAYAFHPLEALVEIGILVIFLFTIPVHRTHLMLFFLFMIVYNVYGHLGFELYPKGFQKHPIGKWVNTAVNHNQHHQHFRGNYGLYFLFWDRVFGTIRKDYDERFDEVKSR
jgi:lathosterol oxidase